MGIPVLIDKLDEIVHNAKVVPLTDQVRVDREEILNILDELRATIPDEIKQARELRDERDRVAGEVERLRDAVKASPGPRGG